MKVTMHTYGGLAGVGAPPVVLDTAQLSGSARHELLRMVRTVSGAPPQDPPGHLADAQTYEITVEHDDGSSAVLQATDGSVAEEFAELRNWLRDRRPK